jgi:hypothetical protein
MHGKRTSDTRPGIGNRLFAGAVFGLAATLVASAAWRGTASWRGAWLVQQLARQTRDQRLPPTPGQFVALAKLDPAAIGQLVASAIDAELLAARAARAALQEIFEVVAAELRADSAKRRGAAVGQLAAAAAGFAAQAPRLSEGDRVWGRRCGQQLAELVGEAPPADAAAILADVETVLRATSDPSAGGGAAVIDRTLRMVAAPRVASFGGAGRPSLAAIGAGPMAADIAIADPERVALAAEREEPGEAFEAAADADAGPSDDEALPDQLGEGPPLPQRLLPREQEPEAETAPRQSLDRVSEAPEARPLAPRAAVDGGSGPVSEPQAKLPGAAGPLGSMPAAEAPPTELQLLVVPSPDRLRQLRNRYRQLATSDLNAALSTAERCVPAGTERAPPPRPSPQRLGRTRGSIVWTRCRRLPDASSCER